MVVDPTGLKVRVKFGHSSSNRARDTRLPPFVRTTMTTATQADGPFDNRVSGALPKNVENAASDGFMWNFSKKIYAMITKFHTVVGDNLRQTVEG